MKGTWSLLRKILPNLPLVGVFVEQLVCAAALGNEQILMSLSPGDFAGSPTGGLIEDGNGVLYGAGSGGGTRAGTVYAINPDGSGFKLLQDFGSSVNDATNPVGPLTLGVDGALYGVSAGGAKGVGAIFTLRTDGFGYRVIYSFGAIGQDGKSPQPPLVQGAAGTLYGATYSGGGSNMGTVFAVGPDGAGYRILHAFQGGSIDGANPQAGLILGKDGWIYGTTASGGTNAVPVSFAGGTVFRLNADGSNYAVLHSFNGNPPDGLNPSGALCQGSDGALYGTTTYFGNSIGGIVFRPEPKRLGLPYPTHLSKCGCD